MIGRQIFPLVSTRYKIRASGTSIYPADGALRLNAGLNPNMLSA
jgi:hypothetical protein